MPSHHQSGFFKALRLLEDVDLRVCYYDTVPESRKRLGWCDAEEGLPDGEFWVDDLEEAKQCVEDWKERVHVLPGTGARFLRRLHKCLLQNHLQWVHWSEPRHPGWRRLVGWPRWYRYGRSISRSALGAFAIGEMAARDFRSYGVSREKIAFLPYSCPPLDSNCVIDRKIGEFAAGHRLFLFCGVLCRRKAVDVLLRAFAKCDADGWKLVLVGNDAEQGRYQRLAGDLDIASRVLFRGPVPARQVAGVVRMADVCVVPSRFDGWGVVVNEAVSLGKPTIVSDRVGAGYHLISPAENGFRALTGSVASLRRCMQVYVNRPELLPIHGERSFELFEGHTPEVNARRFVSIVESWAGLSR